MYQCVYQRNCVLWLTGVCTPVLFLFLLFYCKMIGAGDIKVLSILGGFHGWKFSLKVFLIALVYGGIWSIFKLTAHHNWRERFLYFYEYLNEILYIKKRISYRQVSNVDKRSSIPFCIAIALAYGSCVLGGVC